MQMKTLTTFCWVQRLSIQVELDETDRQLLDEDVSNHKKGFTKKW